MQSGPCADSCRTRLYDTRQVRLALDRDMNRVQRVLIAGDGCCDAQFLHEQHPTLIAIRATPAAAPLLALLPDRDEGRTAASTAQAPRVYLIDPLGNLMMVLSGRLQGQGHARGLETIAAAFVHRLARMNPQRRLLWFRRLALAGAILAAGVVVLGAWVRLTDAGLGCPDWPGCYGHIYPNAGQSAAQSGFHFAKALHEMIHRYFATTLGIIIASLLVWALRFRKDPGQPLIPVAVLFCVVCLQGALGALTVTLLLKPLIVTAHLLGGLTTLGLLCWLSLAPETRAPAEREAAVRKFALVGAAVLAAANCARRLDQFQLCRRGLP